MPKISFLPPWRNSSLHNPCKYFSNSPIFHIQQTFPPITITAILTYTFIQRHNSCLPSFMWCFSLSPHTTLLEEPILSLHLFQISEVIPYIPHCRVIAFLTLCHFLSVQISAFHLPYTSSTLLFFPASSHSSNIQNWSFILLLLLYHPLSSFSHSHFSFSSLLNSFKNCFIFSLKCSPTILANSSSALILLLFTKSSFLFQDLYSSTFISFSQTHSSAIFSQMLCSLLVQALFSSSFTTHFPFSFPCILYAPPLLLLLQSINL